ncbi:unnamed protein product [Trifolium pratense]|uniref:Uncharacterized protein n=1 Tax=Trifolium pratense TaxID=57577 RepID=A0ACB0L163_TRIPR|nr:unnamed protein product [Trifolium pratense]
MNGMHHAASKHSSETEIPPQVPGSAGKVHFRKSGNVSRCYPKAFLATEEELLALVKKQSQHKPQLASPFPCRCHLAPSYSSNRDNHRAVAVVLAISDVCVVKGN